MFKFILSVALFFSLNFFAQAQKEFTWDYYKLGLTLPDDFKVTKNTDHEFECNGIGMDLYMYIFEDDKLTADDMRDETKKLAKQLKFEEVDEIYDFKTRDGFSGKYVLGYKDGKQVMLAGIIQEKSSTNVWVYIEFEDGDHQAKKDGLAILESIEHVK